MGLYEPPVLVGPAGPPIQSFPPQTIILDPVKRRCAEPAFGAPAVAVADHESVAGS
jgi:hypothetical protein